MRDEVYEEIFKNEFTHAWYLGTRQLLLKNLSHFPKATKILDAGCGTGGTIRFLKANGFENIEGIDNSQMALKFAKKNGVSRIKKGSVNNLPYSNNEFDMVICLDVLYHKGVDPKIALKEFNRVLKPGGTVYIQEPAYNWLKSKHDIMIETQRRFTEKQIKSIVEQSGFQIKKSSYFNMIFFVPILLKRLIEKIDSKNLESDVKPLLPVVNKLFLKVLLMEAIVADHFTLPFGLSVVIIGIKK